MYSSLLPCNFNEDISFDYVLLTIAKFSPVCEIIFSLLRTIRYPYVNNNRTLFPQNIKQLCNSDSLNACIQKFSRTSSKVIVARSLHQNRTDHPTLCN